MEFLDEVAAKVPKGVVLMDNTSWHTSKNVHTKLKILGVSPICNVSYVPELNFPIEATFPRLKHFYRKQTLEEYTLEMQVPRLWSVQVEIRKLD